MRQALRAHATAAADVSDGLLIDVVHIADASDVGARLDLDKMPLSGPAQAWLARQPDRAAAALELASGGDDYALVCAAIDPDALIAAAQEASVDAAMIGVFTPEAGLEVLFRGRPMTPNSLGWRHP
jgi:thiamine-monophosphate kinase